MSALSGILQEFLGQEVVIDAVSPYVYLGRLIGGDERWLVLEHADVHDLRDTTTTRELYVLDSRRFGIRSNRQQVLVRVSEVASLSPLADVMT